MLRRWGSISDRPMPASWADFQRQHPDEAIAAEIQDKLLVDLLRGTANARDLASALDGSLTPFAPSIEETEKAAKQAEVQQLYSNNPWISGSVTDQIRLSMLDEGVARRCKAEAAKARTVDNEQARTEARLERARLASVRGWTGTID